MIYDLKWPPQYRGGGWIYTWVALISGTTDTGGRFRGGILGELEFSTGVHGLISAYIGAI